MTWANLRVFFATPMVGCRGCGSGELLVEVNLGCCSGSNSKYEKSELGTVRVTLCAPRDAVSGRDPPNPAEHSPHCPMSADKYYRLDNY